MQAPPCGCTAAGLGPGHRRSLLPSRLWGAHLGPQLGLAVGGDAVRVGAKGGGL